MGEGLKKHKNHGVRREPQAPKSFFRKKTHVTKCTIEYNPDYVVTKIRYASMKDATKVLSKIKFLRKHHNAEKIEKRVYKCHECKGWHITSQD